MYYLFALLIQRKLFWLMRSKATRIKYYFYNLGYKLRVKRREGQSGYSEVIELFSAVQLSFFFAVLFAGLLWGLDKLLDPFYRINSIQAPAISDYISFLSGVAGVGGVFIGLYYAAVGGVVSSIYSKAPPAIRTVFTDGLYGGAYMFYLSFLTVLSLCLVAVTLLVGSIVIISIPVIFCFAGFGVFSFVKLGQKVFNLFDQSYISRRIFQKLAWFGIEVSHGSAHWHLTGFQHHYMRKAVSQISALKSLLGLIASDTVSATASYTSLSSQACVFLTSYSNGKKKIPIDSKWYQDSHVARSWADADHFTASIANRTGTSLMPVVKPDFVWLENDIFEIVLSCLRSTIGLGDYSSVKKILRDISTLAARLAYLGEYALAMQLIESAKVEVFSEDDRASALLTNTNYQVEVTDIISVMPSVVLLGYVGFLNQNTLEEVESRLGSAEWGKRNGMCTVGLPFSYLSTLNWLNERLSFELCARGCLVSPPWYRLEIVRLNEANDLLNALDALSVDVMRFFKDIRNYALSKRIYLCSSICLSREWEYWVKFEFSGPVLFNRYNAIQENKKLEALNWPPSDKIQKVLDFKALHKRGIAKELVESALALEMSYIGVSNIQHADYSGQFLTLAADQFARLAIENDADFFKDCFLNYVMCCGCYFGRTFDPGDPKSIYRSTMFLKEAVEVSGFAKLLSEFHCDDSLASIVLSCWSSVTGGEELEKEVFKKLSVFNDVWNGTFFGLANDFSYREPVISFDHMVRGLPRKVVDQFESEILHARDLIKLYGERYDGLELIDIFMVLIAMPLGILVYKDLTIGQKDLLGALKRKGKV